MPALQTIGVYGWHTTIITAKHNLRGRVQSMAISQELPRQRVCPSEAVKDVCLARANQQKDANLFRIRGVPCIIAHGFSRANDRVPRHTKDSVPCVIR